MNLSKAFKVSIPILMLALVACSHSKNDREPGTDVTDKFLAAHAGSYHDNDVDEDITFNKDRKVIMNEVRQVGSPDTPNVPYPTVCHITKVGFVKVYERSVQDREKYMDYAPYVAKLTTTSVTSNDTSEGCQNFVKTHQGAKYSIYLEALDDVRIRLHTSGGADYVKGQKRTASTLDEVYVRTSRQ